MNRTTEDNLKRQLYQTVRDLILTGKTSTDIVETINAVVEQVTDPLLDISDLMPLAASEPLIDAQYQQERQTYIDTYGMIHARTERFIKEPAEILRELAQRPSAADKMRHLRSALQDLSVSDNESDYSQACVVEKALQILQAYDPVAYAIEAETFKHINQRAMEQAQYDEYQLKKDIFTKPTTPFCLFPWSNAGVIQTSSGGFENIEYEIRLSNRHRIRGQIGGYAAELVKGDTVPCRLANIAGAADKLEYVRELIRRKGLDIDEEDLENESGYVYDCLTDKAMSILENYDSGVFDQLAAAGGFSLSPDELDALFEKEYQKKQTLPQIIQQSSF